jgi:hypothetical protein
MLRRQARNLLRVELQHEMGFGVLASPSRVSSRDLGSPKRERALADVLANMIGSELPRRLRPTEYDVFTAMWTPIGIDSPLADRDRPAVSRVEICCGVQGMKPTSSACGSSSSGT